MRIVIAGATGFVGRALCQRLAAEHEVIAITRSAPAQQSIASRPSNITFRRADLFSLRELQEAMQSADVGIYLVHSMLPPNRLSQGNFSDFDTILADNFARAGELVGLKRIYYLAGLIPNEPLSSHLASRLEVEWILAGRSVPVITFRAGLIVGDQGSSFAILERLVKRLPIMICPRWTARYCQPIYIDDVVEIMARAVQDEAIAPGPYDIGGADRLTYLDMIQRTARFLGLNRFFVPVPFFSPRLSRLWVTVVTGSPRQLVYPLIESLRHDMVADNRNLQLQLKVPGRSFDESLAEILRVRRGRIELDQSRQTSRSGRRSYARNHLSAVTSVQRLPLPVGMSMVELGRHYAKWIHRLLWPVLSVDVAETGSLKFYLRPLGSATRGWLLLALEFCPVRSDPTRQLFYVTGGCLAVPSLPDNRGRLEFRRLAGSDEAIVAVLDFVPRLPWWIYRYTQAIAHRVIMYLFGRHLKKLRSVAPAEV